MGVGRSTKLSPPSRHRKQRQQVAAVCYRVRGNGIEFLLVQTRSGRWIFPKGGVERGLTYAQSAAREALEEAGVHGRVEEVSFARYYRQRPELAAVSQSSSSSSDSKKSRPQRELAVAAYLCEVSHLEPPQESNRNPRWFSVDKVKQRLRKDRTPEFGEELSRAVDRATARIERIYGARRTSERTSQPTHTDGLGMKVRFEAPEFTGLHSDPHKAMVIGYFSRPTRASALARKTALEVEPKTRSVPHLGTAEASFTEEIRNVTSIDSGRKRMATSPTRKHASPVRSVRALTE